MNFYDDMRMLLAKACKGVSLDEANKLVKKFLMILKVIRMIFERRGIYVM